MSEPVLTGASNGAPLNLDNLNLAPLTERACTLLSQLERYCRIATAYERRWCLEVEEPLGFAAFSAIAVEEELARLGLVPGQHPIVVQGGRMRGAAVRLERLLVHLRGGGTEAWGGPLTGGVWAAFRLGSPAVPMPDLTQEVLQLRCIVDDLRECQPAPEATERTNTETANQSTAGAPDTEPTPPDRPQRPTREYCMRQKYQVLWDGKVKIAPRLWSLLDYLLQRDPDDVTFDQLRAEVFERRGGAEFKKDRSILNDISTLNQELDTIKFALRLQTHADRNTCIITARLVADSAG
jgi:hypothetical protein